MGKTKAAPRRSARTVPIKRLWVQVRGAVQGVGFRPFVFRLASDLKLKGWVNNSSAGVTIEVEGGLPELESFLGRLVDEKPPNSIIEGLEHSYLDPVPYNGFEIRASEAGGRKTALVLPDIATCPACLADILDPDNRRHRYPFTNCTHCGPRYSIIEALPYDRPNTTMRGFAMCAECRREYVDPSDRRFHAQPTACPACGPRLVLRDAAGKTLASGDAALAQGAQALRDGKVVAVKGVGGFHLMADASNEAAVKTLRSRKHREEKPFAVLFPSLDSVLSCAKASEAERRALTAPEAPIVLLARRLGRGSGVCGLVAPGSPRIGAMLPSNPLHHILMRDLGFPVVATSGNLSEEPICIDEGEALSRLGSIADLFLVHDRPIARHVDDSIVRVMEGRTLILRRARGFAPLPVRLSIPEDRPLRPTLALGGHLKNTVAVTVEDGVHLSQHIGDLGSLASTEAFEAVISSLSKLYGFSPELAVCDSHPDYHSTRRAQKCGLPVLKVQHHLAHALSCMADNRLSPPVLGIAWDGTGYGPDGTVWGGEFLAVRRHGFSRAAHWRTFPLPGGEKAVAEPRRSAFGLLFEAFGGDQEALSKPPLSEAFSSAELRLLRDMCLKGVGTPATSSVGRLFDAVAFLAGLRGRNAFEGQAAMDLEAAAEGSDEKGRYPVTLSDGPGPLILDWAPMLRGILADRGAGAPAGTVALKFHRTLAAAVAATASAVGIKKVALSGGCFQNALLTRETISALAAAGFEPYWHQRVPPNDGGIALGQAAAAAMGWKDASRPSEGGI
ncbi:MAG: carbamoyltransferase HypF [Elusimicrobia bacterium]|nr:carbamoyltransferase HypF [Elusimicrobiota bacterium]